ncbi:AGPAT5 [Bugula neritina]|uniref:AGPAT5 n=1 Tax=Bugula neritina TaxID=10212 RepID=A0A7J7JE62_BUGNE|nr:AGPAT5 [Bugula neritina]
MNGAQIAYTGDYEEFFSSDENALYISNHQTSVDWIVVDMLAIKQDLLGRIRFMHKDELKYIPFFGLYFWQHSCINVGRFGSFDERKTINQLKYLKNNNLPTWLTIFPEGTRFDPVKTSTIVKSQKFAQNKGWPVLENHLTPRSRGMFLALNHLHSHFNSVYDVTIAYEATRQWSDSTERYTRVKAPGMVDFALGYSPKIHVNIRKINISDVPYESEEEVGRWLHSCFERKDKLMENFLATGQFEEGKAELVPVSKWSQTLPHTLFNTCVTLTCLAFPFGRYAYLSSTFIGSLLGILWMKYH